MGKPALECTEELKDVDEWIQVTFSEPVVIDEVYVSQDIQWSNISEFKILVLEEKEWKEVYTAQYEDQFSSDTIELDEPVTAKAFRIHVTKVIPFTSSADFFEIEVYGMTLEEANATPSPTPEPTPEPTEAPKTQRPAETSPPVTKDSGNNVVYVVWAICIAVIIATVIATVLAIKKNKKRMNDSKKPHKFAASFNSVRNMHLFHAFLNNACQEVPALPAPCFQDSLCDMPSLQVLQAQLRYEPHFHHPYPKQKDRDF